MSQHSKNPFVTLLFAASQRRSELVAKLAAQESQCLRLFDGDGDGRSDFSVDRFGTLLVGRVHVAAGVRGQIEFEMAQEGLRAFCENSSEIESGYLWSESRADVNSGRAECHHVYGPECSELRVRESGCFFHVRPQATPSAGLFLDTRDIRSHLMQFSHGKRVLNTFCFTGSLGIAAACGGAQEVVQVDIQKSILSLCKLNVDSNIIPGTVRIICEDTLSFMRREVRRLESGKAGYDVVIIDPPTFGTSGNVRFSLEKSLGELLALGARLLNPGGELFLTCNTTRISPSSICKLQRAVVPELKVLRHILPPPEDFPSGASEQSANMRGVHFRARGA
jgi:23S rRNA (cytosine1962-C5)-methyltransferase